MLGSVTLIVVLTAGSISSERGTMADSVLSRGISRYQYFLGKWHARLATVLGTYLSLSMAALIGSLVLVHADVSLDGSLVALATVGGLLAAVVTAGVTVSAMSNSSLLSVASLWAVLYGGGFAASWFLRNSDASPGHVLERLPNILCGYYDLQSLATLMVWSAGLALAAAVVGMVFFSRRDV